MTQNPIRSNPEFHAVTSNKYETGQIIIVGRYIVDKLNTLISINPVMA